MHVFIRDDENKIKKMNENWKNIVIDKEWICLRN